ncbi:hypothetical protein GXP67_18860 [Rhodocytophaga rosea]|uniref:Carboxypeptidase-like regulatory domain-containing protein n=1 Tax=Rhodocytophaga rosea TaxID=2704465 RepID=A0A6C0GKL9_9BACT|nr:carboxypeptidase-like regulatory domain-containing protein [Rhodocytophaga rosea]QHT68558.1 hypothetical protein GXP67_18860 [Rhodocytophaga rosea]
MKYCIFLLFWMGPLHLWAQTISGRITDAKNGDGIPGAYILTTDSKTMGTISNPEGYFQFIVPSDVDSLKITHIGYQTVKVAVRDTLQIALTEAVYELSAVEIVQESAYNIILKTIRAIPTNYLQQPQKAKAFYREIIRDSTDYLSVAEAVFNVFTFPGQKENVQLQLVQGRASEEVKVTRLFEDFHPGGMPLLLAGLDIRLTPPTFLQHKYQDKYEYQLDSITYLDGQKIFVIGFDQKATVKEALQQGTLFIEANHFALVRYQASFSQKGLSYIKHLNGEDKLIAGLLNIDFKQLYQNITVTYQPDSSKWALSSVNMQTGIAYKQPRKEIDTHLDISSELLITEQSKEAVSPLPKAAVWQKGNLVINLATDYNDAFWGENNILRPTTALREIVASIQGKEDFQPLQDTNWQVLQPALVRVYQKDSSIYIKPLVKCEWKDDATGPLLYQPARGDFIWETVVSINKASDSTQSPDRGFQAGGILIRDTMQANENHIFLGIGTGGNNNLKLFVQNTLDGNSAVNPVKIEERSWQIRIERSGSVFHLYARGMHEATWEVLKTIERKYFSTQVQVGLAVYAYFPGNGPKMRPDIQVQFNQTQLLQK